MVEIENTFFNCSFFKNKYSQHFRKLIDHIIYGNIKTRYNVFRKYANDVFVECDFTVRKPLKSYYIRLFAKPPRSEAFKRCLLHRDDGTHRRRQQPHGRNDGSCSRNYRGSLQIKSIKNLTHHFREIFSDVSNFFIFSFLRRICNTFVTPDVV